MEDAAVSVRKLERKFGSFVAVNKISFDVKRGEIFGFLGANGAGKTTTIKMLCGILLPTSGEGRVGGFDIMAQNEQIKENIGYMSQKFSLYEDLTVEENINFYGGIYKIKEAKLKDRMEWVIEMAGLKDNRNNLTGVLSGGWKQRLALGCAILHEPKIIFLDEPTSGVDPMSRMNFWKIINDMADTGVTVFVTTHYMDEAENCARLALVYKGNIIALDSPEHLKKNLMKDQILQVCVNEPQFWMDSIENLNIVKEVSLFGTSMHVVTDNAKKAESDMSTLFNKKSQQDFKIQKVEPTLEDVFVSLIEHYEKEHPQNEIFKT